LYCVVENISQKEEFTASCSDVFPMYIGKLCFRNYGIDTHAN